MLYIKFTWTSINTVFTQLIYYTNNQNVKKKKMSSMSNAASCNSLSYLYEIKWNGPRTLIKLCHQNHLLSLIMDLFEPTILCPLRAVELSLDLIYVVDACKDTDDWEALSDDREALSELPSPIDSISDAIVRTASLLTSELNLIVLSIPTIIYQEGIRNKI